MTQYNPSAQRLWWQANNHTLFVSVQLSRRKRRWRRKCSASATRATAFVTSFRGCIIIPSTVYPPSMGSPEAC